MRDVPISRAVAPNAAAFDAAMREAFREPSRILLDDGVYPTAGLSEWNRTRADRGFILNGTIESAGASKATIVLDPSAIVDTDITDEPQRAITGRGVWDDPTSGAEIATDPEAIWRRVARDQALRNVRIVGNHSVLLPRWRARGKSLRTSGFLLLGHDAIASGVDLVDFGAWRADPAVGAETFPGSIAGATAAGDTVAIAQLDPATHEFEQGGIVDCTFSGYVPNASNDQVTVFMIVGSFGEANGWTKGDWRFHWRKYAHHEGNSVEASGSNLVQCHTTYLAEAGTVTRNKSKGADRGYYGDYLQTRGQLIEGNDWQECRHGISLLLSPGPPVELARDFFHENYQIGENKIGSSGANVLIRTLAPEWALECQKAGASPTPNTRRIRNISIHPSLTYTNEGATGVTGGIDLNARKGCNPFRR